MKKEMLEIVSAEARKKLEDQLNTVDQKIGVILGFVGVVLVLAFDNKPNQLWPQLFYLSSLFSFVASIIILFLGYRSIRVKTGLSIKGYLEEIKELEPKKDLISFVEDQVLYFQEAISTNNSLIRQKNRYLACGIVMLLAGLFFYIINTLI